MLRLVSNGIATPSMINPKLMKWILTLWLGCVIHNVQAQSLSASEIYHELLKFAETKRVLYVAAHPDDENTRLIAYLANEEKAAVGYLSLTRGDGGQNLIGSELGIGLGQIRTQELLKARETDGGRQFFTRAKDFGFSKNPDETLGNWEKEVILSDVVWVIRRFRPDIIITRFNTIPGVTHGHHTTSALLAEEAFDLAGDLKAFPEQLKWVEPWSPKRIFWNAYNFRGEFEPEEGEKYHEFPTGNFNPILGKSYSQIAADSRTMHKSQGFGSTAGIGAAVDHIQFIKGEPFAESPFEGVASKWLQLKEGEEIEKQIQELIKSFEFRNPSELTQDLLELRKRLLQVDSSETWLLEKKSALDQLIVQVLGLDFEFNSRSETGFPGSVLQGEFVFNNPSDIKVKVSSLEVENQMVKMDSETEVLSNQPLRQQVKITIPEESGYSQPYWLEGYFDGPMYPIEDQLKIGNAFNSAAIAARFQLVIEDQNLKLEAPLQYKFNDQVDGEIKQPFVIVPEIDLSLSKSTVFNLKNSAAELTVTVNFRDQIVDGELSFEGLGAEEFRIVQVNDDAIRKQRKYQVEFLRGSSGKKTIIARYQTADGKFYNQITNNIIYKHIPNLTYFQPAAFSLIQADWEISGDRVGYIPGAGDDVPQVLQALGYPVTMIGAGDYNLEYLSQFKTILVGIRAYNINTDLASNQQIMMGYVRSGGNLIVQYNTSSPLLTNQLGPYPFQITRDRVAVETAEVLADYNHPLLQGPNPIKPEDFDDWVQERGLYFAGELSDRYTYPFTMNDPGEDPKVGSLIQGEYGEGTFVYTGLSFFRQLPAGVTGAIKLFINLIEQP